LTGGPSLTTLQSYIADDGMYDTGNLWETSDVECAMPAVWTPGVTFTCYAYFGRASGNVIAPGTAEADIQVTVLSTQPGSSWNVDLYWTQPVEGCPLDAPVCG
jgi:hypothetical protein